FIPMPSSLLLFPYTTLFRSLGAGRAAGGHAGRADGANARSPAARRELHRGRRPATAGRVREGVRRHGSARGAGGDEGCAGRRERDRKSTRLNSSHVKISYAV